MLDILGKYLKGKKCHFYIYPKAEKDRHEVVILIHGLIRRSYNMYPMAKFLCKNGFTVYVYDYKTSIKDMAAHGDDLRNYLNKVIAETPSNVPIDIVTHSMGGILTRYALAENDKTPRIGYFTHKANSHACPAAWRVENRAPFCEIRTMHRKMV